MSKNVAKSTWSVDTLHEHVERELTDLRGCMMQGFASQQLATDKALQSAQTAVDKAERLAELRSETQDRIAAERSKSQNEWRASLSDMTATYTTQVQYEAAHQMLIDKIDANTERMNRIEGMKTGTDQTIPWAIAAVSGLIAFAALIINILTHVKF